MKYPILTTLAAAALLTGCYRLPDDGGNTGERFKLEFAPVRSVTVDSWGDPQPLSNRAGTAGGTTPSEPPQPPSFPTTVRIEGSGSVETPWANTTGAAIAAQRGNISLSYAFAIDNGCKATAEQAQREGRSLQVEGFGTVAELAVAMAQVCYPGPISGGGSTGGSTGGSVGSGTATSNALLAYPCSLPPQPVEPQRAGDPAPEDPTIPGCWCQPPRPSFYVRAEKIASCSLGGVVIEPPTPAPSPL